MKLILMRHTWHTPRCGQIIPESRFKLCGCVCVKLVEKNVIYILLSSNYIVRWSENNILKMIDNIN